MELRTPTNDTTLSQVDFHIMLAISTTALDSFRILQFIDTQTNDRLEIGLQTIYAHLSHLLKQRLVMQSESPKDGTPSRKTYTLTIYGKNILRREILRMETLVKQAYMVGLMD